MEKTLENKENDLNKNIYTSLKELGLHDSEARLYVASLKLGPSSISTIAKQLGIPRPNVYKAISGLEKQGLASFTGKKRFARTFIVESPTVLLEKLKKKKGEINDIDQVLTDSLPDLLAKYHQGETPTKIKIFNNKDDFIKIYFQILDEEGEETEFFGSANDFLRFVSRQEEELWREKRKKRGIFIRSLVLPGAETDRLLSEKQHMREVRVIELSPFNTSFQLFANKALIWQPASTLVVQIEDEYIVAMLRSIFEKLWESAK